MPVQTRMHAEREEEEEMRSPGRAPPRHIPMGPPARCGLVGDREVGAIPTRPAKHHGGGSPLRLLPLSPDPHNVQAPPPYTSLHPPRSMEWGARQSARSTSGMVHNPPPPPPRERGCSLTGVGP